MSSFFETRRIQVEALGFDSFNRHGSPPELAPHFVFLLFVVLKRGAYFSIKETTNTKKMKGDQIPSQAAGIRIGRRIWTALMNYGNGFFMERTQFEAILSELKKIDAKNDDRFELIKSEFETVRARVGEVKTETQDLRAETQALRAETQDLRANVKSRFDRVDDKLNGIYKQVGETHEDVTDLKIRVSALEASSP